MGADGLPGEGILVMCGFGTAKGVVYRCGMTSRGFHKPVTVLTSKQGGWGLGGLEARKLEGMFGSDHCTHPHGQPGLG